MSIDYSPPTPQELRRLKEALGFTGEQMASLFGLAGNNQWRKYTGGEQPREMSAQMLFFGLARLELDDQSIGRILERMRKTGAQIDLAPDGEPQP
ncbi:XRE family transcriptional regulator [Ralstonia nicotianae]|uniref:XRE family transcriptional regulator n=1 Tax=Ralstonia pseudosolanacearum TaxID=1310165 RepID=UPI00336A7E00